MFIVRDARPLLQSFKPYTTGRLQDKYGCPTLLGLSPPGFQQEDVGLHDDKRTRLVTAWSPLPNKQRQIVAS